MIVKCLILRKKKENYFRLSLKFKFEVMYYTVLGFKLEINFGKIKLIL